MASDKCMYGRSSIVLQALFYMWGSAQQNRNGTWKLKLAGFCRVDCSRTFISSVDKQVHHTEVHTNSGYGAAAGACSYQKVLRYVTTISERAWQKHYSLDASTEEHDVTVVILGGTTSSCKVRQCETYNVLYSTGILLPLYLVDFRISLDSLPQ